MTIACCKSAPSTLTAGAAATLAPLAARVACALELSIQRFVRAGDQDLGHLEVQVAQDVRELLRHALELGAQAKADATPPLSPLSGHPLTRRSAGHRRTFDTRAGAITVQRTRGYCKRSGKWCVPADTALGLAQSAGYSPGVQDLAALVVSKLPVAEASVILAHLTGVHIPPATLAREAHRQGERAQRLCTELDQPAAPEPVPLPRKPYRLIIPLDAWNIRERDAWGQSAARRRAGQEPERWHWVYTGTCFRLDHRGQTAGGTPHHHRTRLCGHPRRPGRLAGKVARRGAAPRVGPGGQRAGPG